MARQPKKTLVDYLVIAISPVLIMLLLGSLTLFLVAVFYRGNYSGRLEYVLTLFVIGAVLIGRIAIEQGREHAMLFAFPLGGVALLASARFVHFHGALANWSFWINCGLITLIGWSANKLVWDCTFIDEETEDPGEGLLEVVGLETSKRPAVEQEAAPAAATPAAKKQPPQGWWGRWLANRRRTHAPGVWVVYFSLAALPLFAIGQVFLPSGNLAVRQAAFRLLCVYTASGLALLMATSFLGLRRYLRQRRLEMPLAMVNAWLAVGSALIVGVMALALFIPRPNAEYAVSELPFEMGSPDQHSSRFGQGRDGVNEKKPWARGDQRDDKKSDSVAADKAGKGRGQNPQITSAQGKTAGKEKGDSGQGKSADQPQSGQKNATEQNAQTQGKDSPQSQQQGQSQQAAEKSDAARDKSAPESQPQDKQNNASSPANQPPDEKDKAAQNSRTQSQENGSGSSSRPQTPPLRHPPFSLPEMPSPLGWLKWIVYVVLGGAILYAAWTHREQLAAAMRDFVAWLRNIWGNLFGGHQRHRDADEEEAGLQATSLARFVDFENPFSNGTAEQCSGEELVRYTFEALEAWGRDHGCPRELEQTPHEFARHLAEDFAVLEKEAKPLADLYCRVAYASGTVSSRRLARLPRIWAIMEAETVWST